MNLFPDSRAPSSIGVPIESFHLFRNPKSEITPSISTISPSSQCSLSSDEILSLTWLGIEDEAIVNSKAIFSFS